MGKLIRWLALLAPVISTLQITSAYVPSERELRQLAKDLAPKVNFFRAVWEVDPKAEFYAGTTRDFVYWIMRQFQKAKTLEQVAEVRRKLKDTETIDIRRILGPDSDVDVMSEDFQLASTFKTKAYGVRKIDAVSFERVHAKTDLGRTEVDQGFVPAEKMRLSLSRGLVEEARFGTPLAELVTGDLSVTFGHPTKFWKTHFAKSGINHPALLALRYIRILAQDYFNRYGDGYPEEILLIDRIPQDLQKQIQEVFSSALTDEKFERFLNTDQGQRWFNATLIKCFRSHTNPTAGHLLLKHFGVDKLIAAYPKQIKPINQFLFLEKRDQQKIEAAFRKWKVNDKFAFESLADYFPNGRFYHGAGSYEAFRAILFQGVIPSEEGSAGGGLYGVGEKDISFAENWAKDRSGRKDLVVEFELSPEARLMDITEGKGKKLFQAWLKAHPKLAKDDERFTLFARTFGVDILRYEYGTKEAAFVVKNSAVLKSAQGYRLKLLTLEELLKEAEVLTQQTFPDFLGNFALSNPVPAEVARILSKIPKGFFEKAVSSGDFENLIVELPTPADRARTFRAFVDGAKLVPGLTGLVKKIEERFWWRFRWDLEHLDLPEDDFDPLWELLEFVTFRQKMKLFQELENLEVRRELFSSLRSDVAAGQSPDFHRFYKLLISSLNDRDPGIRITAATELNIQQLAFGIHPTKKLHLKSLRALLKELDDPKSEYFGYALEEFMTSERVKYVHPESIEKFTALLKADLPTPAKFSVLFWLYGVYFPKPDGNWDAKSQGAIRRTSPQMDEGILKLLRDSDPEVQATAAMLRLALTASRSNLAEPFKSPEDRFAVEVVVRAAKTFASLVPLVAGLEKQSTLRFADQYFWMIFSGLESSVKVWIGRQVLGALKAEKFEDGKQRLKALKVAVDFLIRDPSFNTYALKFLDREQPAEVKVSILEEYLSSHLHYEDEARHLAMLMNAYAESKKRSRPSSLSVKKFQAEVFRHFSNRHDSLKNRLALELIKPKSKYSKKAVQSLLFFVQALWVDNQSLFNSEDLQENIAVYFALEGIKEYLESMSSLDGRDLKLVKRLHRLLKPFSSPSFGLAVARQAERRVHDEDDLLFSPHQILSLTKAFDRSPCLMALQEMAPRKPQ